MAYTFAMTSRLKFSALRLLLAGLPGSASEVRGGRVIDHEYHLNWLDRRTIHAATYPLVNQPDAYRSTNPPSEP